MSQTNPPTKSPSKALTRFTAAILTVAFLGFVFAALVGTLVHSGEELNKAVRRMTILQAYLPEEWDALDLLQARISSFTNAVSEHMWRKEGMGYINSAFQYALGKKVINTGNQNMITLTTGHLYDLMDYKSLRKNAEDIVALRETTLGGIPFLFVYEHPTLYDPDMLPAGYEALDHSAQMADEALSALREGGIEVMDSREVLPASGRSLDELLMVTDQHWTTLAAITMAQAIAARVDGMTGAGLDPSLLDPEKLNTLVHEKLFLGKYGQRVGTRVVDPDDIIEYWPKYDTEITRDTLRVTNRETVTGSFREAVTRFDRLEPDPGRTWNTTAYTYYGQVESYNNFHNEAAPEFTLLLLKDSYSAPIGTFLSLLARDVITVDLRRDVDPLEVWIEKYHPDAVVMAYSLQMLRDDAYEFN